jgi:ring-1,2-phenylacetyl-CoA epoxidase subunit PaaC
VTTDLKITRIFAPATNLSTLSTHQLFTYTLHLADNALILAQRNAEWTGHGPVLEQDIAITNIALDGLGQARNLYHYAAEIYTGFGADEKKAANDLIPRLWKTFNRELNEDYLAFLRDEHQYLNLLLTELPRGDWAQTVLRQTLFSTFQLLQYEGLKNSSDTQLAAIAEKAVKEVTYHLRWSSEWVIRLGDGTRESNQRLRNALEELWPYTGELFTPVAFEQQASLAGFGTDMAFLKSAWQQKIAFVFKEATLQLPDETGTQHGGKEGRHTEYLGYLLTEMQYLQRVHPNAVW